MYVNNAIVLKQSPNKACNGLGALFTLQPYSYVESNQSPVENYAQVLSYDVYADSTFWKQIKGSFIADSTYTHLVVGNFLDSANVEVVNVSGVGPLETIGEAYYYIDEVRLSTDSSFAWQPLSVNQEKELEIRAYPNPTTSRLELSGIEGFRNYNVFSFEGRLVLSGILRDKHEIDLSSLPEGMYLIQLSSGTRKETIRVVKTN